MAIQDRLIGKLGGGGGKPETAKTQVRYSSTVRPYNIPYGWKRAQGTFSGTAREVAPMIFGQWFDGLRSGTPCNGGGSSPTTPLSKVSMARSRGCAWNNPQGGGRL